LIALRDTLARANVPLIFAIYPSHRAVYDSLDEQIRWVERTAREVGLATVDFTPPLQKDGRSKEELFLFPYDGHPSVAGYATVAPSLVDALVALPVMTNRCTAGKTPAP
jgi:lysophospholipase L1-like esterase